MRTKIEIGKRHINKFKEQNDQKQMINKKFIKLYKISTANSTRR